MTVVIFRFQSRGSAPFARAVSLMPTYPFRMVCQAHGVLSSVSEKEKRRVYLQQELQRNDVLTWPVDSVN